MILKNQTLNIKSNYKSMISYKDFSKSFQNNYWNCIGGGNHSPSGPGFNNKKGCNEEELSTHAFQKKFLQPTSTGLLPEHCIFELIKENVKVKPFYDIDKGFDSKEECDKNEIILLESFTDYIKTIYPLGVLSISTATGWKTKYYTKDKIKHSKLQYFMSYHIVINNYETTLLENKYFNESHGLYKKFDFVDKGIYRDTYGLLRCLYANKPWELKSPRFKVIFENDDPLSHLIQSNEDTNIGFNKIQSPPVSPVKSIKMKTIRIKKETIEPPNEEVINEEDDEEVKVITKKKEYEPVKMSVLFETLKLIKHKWLFYNDIIPVCMALFNECLKINELDDGLYFIKKWIKEGEPVWRSRNDRTTDDYNEFIPTQWKYWTKRNEKLTHERHKKLTFGSLKHWAKESLEQDDEEKYKWVLEQEKPYKELYYMNMKKIGINSKNGLDEYEGVPNEEGLIKFMNKKLIFVKSTGEYIVKDKKKVMIGDSEKLIDCWYLKNSVQVIDFFINESFFIKNIHDRWEEKNPFTIWRKSKQRREVHSIGFDPSNSSPDIFNLWNGFNISKEDCEEFDEKDSDPIKDHILNIWCKGDENSMNYILNLFAWYIQKPHIK